MATSDSSYDHVHNSSDIIQNDDHPAVVADEEYNYDDDCDVEEKSEYGEPISSEEYRDRKRRRNFRKRAMYIGATLVVISAGIVILDGILYTDSVFIEWPIDSFWPSIFCLSAGISTIIVASKSRLWAYSTSLVVCTVQCLAAIFSIVATSIELDQEVGIYRAMTQSMQHDDNYHVKRGHLITDITVLSSKIIVVVLSLLGCAVQTAMCIPYVCCKRSDGKSISYAPVTLQNTSKANV